MSFSLYKIFTFSKLKLDIIIKYNYLNSMEQNKNIIISLNKIEKRKF